MNIQSNDNMPAAQKIYALCKTTDKMNTSALECHQIIQSVETKRTRSLTAYQFEVFHLQMHFVIMKLQKNIDTLFQFHFSDEIFTFTSKKKKKNHSIVNIPHHF